MANIPPAKRGAFYAAVQTAFPLLADPATARMPAWQRLEQGIEAISPPRPRPPLLRLHVIYYYAWGIWQRR